MLYRGVSGRFRSPSYTWYLDGFGVLVRKATFGDHTDRIKVSFAMQKQIKRSLKLMLFLIINSASSTRRKELIDTKMPHKTKNRVV